MASILFITTRVPYPPWEGHQIRTYNLLKSVCHRHEVHLLSFARRDDAISQTSHLRDICASVELVEIPVERSWPLFLMELLKSVVAKRRPFVVRKYCAPRMERMVRKHIELCSPDLIHLDMLPLAQYIPLTDGRPVVLNEHNVESLLMKRRAESSASVMPRWFFSIQAKKLYGFERWACRNADRVVACSPDDVAVLQKMSKSTTVKVVANGVDVDYFVPQTDPVWEPHNIVFVGGMGWFPNRDGMEFFLHRVMPLIRERIPDATLSIVGKTEGLEIPARLRQSVNLPGFVEDLRPWVNRAAVYVIPLRVGSGTRLKLLEAMAMAKPIVSTTVGCEGVAVQHGRHLLIADDGESMASAVCELMHDRELAARIARNARALALERYDWKLLGSQMLSIYDELLGQVDGVCSELVATCS